MMIGCELAHAKDHGQLSRDKLRNLQNEEDEGNISSASCVGIQDFLARIWNFAVLSKRIGHLNYFPHNQNFA